MHHGKNTHHRSRKMVWVGEGRLGCFWQPGCSMKKRGLLVLCALILALMAITTIAYADEDPVTCAIELAPAYLSGPGEVNVTITISNTTDQDLQDPVILFSPQAEIITDFGNGGSAILKAGESQTWTGTYSINERELEQGFIQYFAKYTVYKENGQATPRSQAIRATVSRQEAAVAIDVERTITPSAAHEGQEIQVKYAITNAGTVALEDVTIVENEDINSKAQTVPKLDPGAKVELTYKATMEKSNLTSSAKITYKAEGSSKEETYTVDEKVISFAETNLVAELSSSTKGVVAGGTLTLTLELKNKGSADMSDIRVTDAVLGDVFTNQKVDAGKTITLEKEITLTETSDYQFIINAVDSTGTEVSTASNTLTITAMNPDDALHLTLTAVPDRTEVYDDPAGVRFTITIANDSKVDATDVAISHGTMELYTFESIKAGESRTLSRDTVLSTSGKFQFTATAKDPLENESSFQSNEMQIAVYEPTPVPATPTPPPVPTAEPTFVPATWAPIHHESIGTVPKAIQKVLLPALIIAGILLLASAGLLIVAAKKRLENKKASEAAFDHLERARRRDYTVVNPEEMAAASKATLSQNSNPADFQETDYYAEPADGWDLPPVESLSQPAEQDDFDGEQYSSFGQGFYGEIGDDGFEDSQSDYSYGTQDYDAPNDGQEILSFDSQYGDEPSFEQDASYGVQAYEPQGDYQSDGYQPDAFQPYDGTEEDLFKFDQPETMGDDRMSYQPQAFDSQYEGYESQYDGFEDYQNAYDGYEPLPEQQPYDGYEPLPDQQSQFYGSNDQPFGHPASEQPRSRRSRK